jgi:obg-like ATPase 1
VQRTPRAARRAAPARRGASSGEGLGNAFLSNIAAVDGIFHVCRAFEDADVVHVEDRVDPVEDLEIIHKCGGCA